MSEVYVFFATGFEEIEGLTCVDLMRRADIDVTTVSVTGEHTVVGSHKIPVQMDKLFDELFIEPFIEGGYNNERETENGTRNQRLGK